MRMPAPGSKDSPVLILGSSVLTLALTALMGFAIGFIGIRWAEGGIRHGETMPASESPGGNSASTAQGADVSSAMSKARIAAALALGENGGGLAHDAALYSAIRKLDARDFLDAAGDFPALIVRLNKGTNGQGSVSIMSLAEAWMDRWLEVDTQGALKFLGNSTMLADLAKNQPFGPMASWNTAQIGAFRVLARRQPEWTLAYLAAQPSMQQIGPCVFNLLREVALQDPAKARRFAAGFANGPNRQAAMNGLVKGMMAVDARAGFDIVAAEPAGPARERLLNVAMSGAAERGLATVRELLDRTDNPRLRRELAAQALFAMHDAPRENLLPWIMEESKRGVKLSGSEAELATRGASEWQMDVAQAVQGEHVAEAAEWAMNLTDDPKREMFGSILSRWSSADPVAFRAWVADHLASLDAAGADKLGDILRPSYSGANEELQTWAASLPTGRFRDQLQFQIRLSAVSDGKVAQATAAYDSIAAYDADGALAKRLATEVAKKDGAAAAEWAMRLAPGPVHDGAVVAVAQEWSQRDPNGAAQWIEQFPAGRERDVILREYAAKVVYADPATAAAWVEQMANPAVRAQAVEKVFEVWNRENPVAARAWVQDIDGVDEVWKRKFLGRR